jgi:hypothetical protein
MDNGRKVRHDAAMTRPRPGFELALVNFIGALQEYSDAHYETYKSHLADDYVIGDEWQTIAKSVIGLLTGEHGRLDGGSLDSRIRDIAERAGFTRDIEVLP